MQIGTPVTTAQLWFSMHVRFSWDRQDRQNS